VVGAEEEMKAIDPEIASNPLIFPPQDVLDRVKAFDPNASKQRGLQAEVSRRWSGPDARAAMTNRRLTPYLLLAPGIAFLAVFFVVPLY
jgi:hypothetical protein